MKKQLLHASLSLLLLGQMLNPAQAAIFPKADVPTRMKGAQKMVVGTVLSQETHWDETPGGEKHIFTRSTLKVEEVLRGPSVDTIDIELEGGTIDGLTLRTDDLPELKVGDR